MARPTKYTSETAEEIIAGIAVGLTNKDAALAAGISEDTFIRWNNRYADFANRVTRAKSQRSRTWLKMLRDNAAKGDTKAIAELLDRCAPDYRKTVEHDHKHSGSISHTHRDLSIFTDEEVANLAVVAERAKAERVS